MVGVTDLTVVVPTYNGAQHLAATLDALAAQTIPPQVLVVDDGSSDDSVLIARSHPVSATVLEQPNRGVAAARNRGLAVASTTYVAFSDQDDLWHPRRVEVLLGLADETGAAAVGTAEQPFALEADRERLRALGDGRVDWDVVWVRDQNPAAALAAVQEIPGYDEVTLERFMEGAATLTTSFMYDRVSAITAGGCAPFVRAADDHVLNVNLAKLFGPLVRARSSLLLYRLHPEATTQSSPLVLPLLTLQLALRHGRALPAEARLGPNLKHLLHQVADQDALSWDEQLALVTLSVDRDERLAERRRWARRRLRRSVRRWRTRAAGAAPAHR